MKPAAFAYARASSVAEALALLAAAGGTARLLAGGQSLAPMMALRLARPASVIDIKRAGLRGASEASGRVRLGACVTHADIEDGAVPDPSRGLMPRIARGIAYRAVRNRGTLGGSLVHADPAADWPPAMLALDAEMLVEGPQGARRVPAADFVTGAFTTALAEHELLVAVEIPCLSEGARVGHCKINRKTGEFAQAIGLVVHDAGRGVARVVAGAVEAPPVLLPRAAAALLAGSDPLLGIEAELAECLPHLDADAVRLRGIALRRALTEIA
jgi:carbon-monoxide dehydrogenase medium subunit